MPKETSAQAPKLSVFKLVMIASAFTVSVRNLPMMAETGLYLIFFSIIGVIAFLIPSALVSAELATGWPKLGGVYAWVKEAFGNRWGFMAIWLQWAQMLFGMVTILAYVGGSLAFAGAPALAENNLFIVAVILITYWAATLLNLRGMQMSGIISTVCLILGVFIPGALLFVFGLKYLLSGNPIQISLALTFKNLMPPLNQFSTISLLAGFIFVFSGMETSAAHANEVENPQKNYPIAILWASIILVVINVIGSLIVAMVIPQDNINLNSGIMDIFQAFFTINSIRWMIPVVAILTGFGAIGQVSTWIVGPVKGLLATAQDGNLPPFLARVNRNGIPTTLLIIQASLVSIISLLFVFVPDINNSFWMLLDLTIFLYLIMYILMFAAAIYLRYKEPDTPRAYRIPGGNAGMWLIAGAGILVSLFTIFVGFFPPSQLPSGNLLAFEGFRVIGAVVMIVIPLIIFRFRKPEWKGKSS
ncbi:MAG: amino acid permease [Candidatus Margulisiibacteriota bacterium]|nr:APC family permease [Candidatus Margulisiibacteriota bacterium]